MRNKLIDSHQKHHHNIERGMDTYPVRDLVESLHRISSWTTVLFVVGSPPTRSEMLIVDVRTSIEADSSSSRRLTQQIGCPVGAAGTKQWCHEGHDVLMDLLMDLLIVVVATENRKG
jgi:hypothetical protein